MCKIELDSFAGWFFATPSALLLPMNNCSKEKKVATTKAILKEGFAISKNLFFTI